jgi:hypothetical protein
MPPKEQSPAALAQVARQPVAPWHHVEWQKLWLGTQGRSWRSLALVPAVAGFPADLTLRVAERLARTGMVHLGAPIRVIDGTKVPLSQLVQFTEEVERIIRFGDLVLLAVSPIGQNPVALTLARAADAAVLCVVLDETKTSQAERTVEDVGRARFVGSLIASVGMDAKGPTKASARRKK